MSPLNHKIKDHKLFSATYILCNKKIGNKKIEGSPFKARARLGPEKFRRNLALITISIFCHMLRFEEVRKGIKGEWKFLYPHFFPILSSFYLFNRLKPFSSFVFYIKRYLSSPLKINSD